MAASLMMITAEKSSAFVSGRTSYVERYLSSCSYVQLRFQTYNRIDIAFDHLTHHISCRTTGVLRADPLATKAAAIWRPLPTEMQHLSEESRAKILGLNMARMFKFDVDGLLARRTRTAATLN